MLTELGGSQVEVQRAHWAAQVPGWGPAVLTELGRSQVEVERCSLSWAGPRLGSSGAHWARTLAKSSAKSLAEEKAEDEDKEDEEEEDEEEKEEEKEKKLAENNCDKI